MNNREIKAFMKGLGEDAICVLFLMILGAFIAWISVEYGLLESDS